MVSNRHRHAKKKCILQLCGAERLTLKQCPSWSAVAINGEEHAIHGEAPLTPYDNRIAAQTVKDVWQYK
eukprot:494247-Amphidinium_carterae.3